MKCKCHSSSNEQVISNVESHDSFDEQVVNIRIQHRAANYVYDEN
jgi:hypothetical protein